MMNINSSIIHVEKCNKCGVFHVVVSSKSLTAKERSSIVERICNCEFEGDKKEDTDETQL